MDTKNNQGKLPSLILKLLGLFLICFGLIIAFYVFFPLAYWQLVIAPSISDQNIITPIPNEYIVSGKSIQNLFENATSSLNNVNYQDARTWFPEYEFKQNKTAAVKSYTISIPKLKIYNATVSTVDTDLTKHLVNYSGTANPPENGNAVIFGHSSLPQFYNPSNYKTIFTYLYKLKAGDEIFVNYKDEKFKYKVENISIIDPDDVSILEQSYNTSFITLVTCAPPGTVWKRLIVRATIESI